MKGDLPEGTFDKDANPLNHYMCDCGTRYTPGYRCRKCDRYWPAGGRRHTDWAKELDFPAKDMRRVYQLRREIAGEFAEPDETDYANDCITQEDNTD